MTTGQTPEKEPKLTLIGAFRYFLKGNKLFALNGIVLYLINSVIILLPPLFQQVYTDNIIFNNPLLTDEDAWEAARMAALDGASAISLWAWIHLSVWMAKVFRADNANAYSSRVHW